MPEDRGSAAPRTTPASADALWLEFRRACIEPIYAGAMLKDVAQFYRQLATLVGAGISLGAALENQSRNLSNERLRNVAAEAYEHVLSGRPFSDVLFTHPELFSPMQTEMIRAAELSGSLHTSLDRLAAYLEEELETRRLVSRLTIYPKLLAVAALLITGRGLFGIGDGTGVVGLVLTGDIWAYFWDTIGFALEIGLIVGGAVAVFRMYLFRSASVRESYERIKMSLPGIGGCVRRFAFARFGRAFATMYEAGMPIGTAIATAGTATGTTLIARATARIEARVRDGGSLASAFAKAGIFPPMVVSMLTTGEDTGNVDAMMHKAAEYLESEARTRAHQNAFAFGMGLYLLIALIIAKYVIGFWAGYAAGLGSA